MQSKEIKTEDLFKINTDKANLKLSDKDRKMIKAAFILFDGWINNYLKVVEDTSTKQDFNNNLNTQTINNPFSFNMSSYRNSLNKEQVMKLILYKWFDSLAVVSTPQYADGHKVRSIRRKIWKDFIGGKYVTSESIKKLNDVFKRLIVNEIK